jgi:hypothetical protein
MVQLEDLFLPVRQVEFMRFLPGIGDVVSRLVDPEECNFVARKS